jgi:uncharacterized protein
MNRFRPYASAIAAAIGLTLSLHVQAQSAPMQYSLQGDSQISRVTSKQQQDEVIALFTRLLALRTASDASVSTYDDVVTPDAVFEYPYATEESLRHIEGPSAIAQALRKLGALAGDGKFSEIRLFETPHPDVFFVQYKASAAIPGGKHDYQQTYLTRITVRDGKIAGYFELWDRAVQEAAVSASAQQ